MDSLGERLKKAREEKNASLKEAENTIRINRKILEALENDQYDYPLPSVYLKGFLRSYCRYLGLNERELSDLYDKINEGKRIDEPQEIEKTGKKINIGRLFFLLILLTGLIGYLGYITLFNHPSEIKIDSQPQKNFKKTGPETSSPKDRPIIPVVTAQQEKKLPEKQKALSSFIPVNMVVKSQFTTWMEVVIDGDSPFEATLVRGDVVSWEGKEKIELKIGNARGITLDVNDIPLKPFGKFGEVVRLTFQGNTFSINGGEHQNLETWQQEKTSDFDKE